MALDGPLVLVDCPKRQVDSEVQHCKSHNESEKGFHLALLIASDMRFAFW
jgi:hypothetical protein